LKNKLLDLNKQLAIRESKVTFNDMVKQRGESKSKSDEYDSKCKERDKIISEIRELENKKSSIDIAKDIINKYLQYIFFDKNRISIDTSSGKYIVKSRNNHLDIKSLSLGERNIISLCYFFLEILNNTEKTDMYSEEVLCVIDDPISSFDHENKIGVYTFIRMMIDNICKGNISSRILIFTHELETLYNFEKVRSDIKLNGICYLLINKELKNYGERTFNLYSGLLNQIYDFACKNAGYEANSSTIGNTMRKALEAFGTFTYKKGIETLSTDDEILDSINNQGIRAIIKNLMYRLVVHGESHLQNTAQGYPENNFYDFVDIDEKVRTAKEILIMINALNRLHLKSHLKIKGGNSIDSKMSQIQEWTEEISEF